MKLPLGFSKDEPGVAVSAFAHVAMLAAGLVAFSSAPKPFAEAQEAIAVEVVDPTALNEVMRGERSAPAVQTTPRPRVERQSEVAEQRNPGEQARDVPTPPTRPPEMKVAERNEEALAPAATPPPAARPQPPAPRPPARPESAAAPEPPKQEARPREAARPEPKPEMRREQLAALAEQAELQAQRERAAEEARAAARARAEAEARVRQQREAREKAEAEARERAETQRQAREQAEAEARARADAQAAARARAEADARARAEAQARAKAAADARARAEAEARAKREAEVAARFNAGDISRLLNSREQPQAAGSTGREVNRVASLGTQTGSAQRMSPSMMGEIRDLLQRRIEECYSPPPGAVGRRVVNPFVSVELQPDGSLAAQPRITRSGPSPLDQAVAGAALRAFQRCSKFTIPAKFAPFHAEWKSLSVEFVPPES